MKETTGVKVEGGVTSISCDRCMEVAGVRIVTSVT